MGVKASREDGCEWPCLASAGSCTVVKIWTMPFAIWHKLGSPASRCHGLRWLYAHPFFYAQSEQHSWNTICYELTSLTAAAICRTTNSWGIYSTGGREGGGKHNPHTTVCNARVGPIFRPHCGPEIRPKTGAVFRFLANSWIDCSCRL